MYRMASAAVTTDTGLNLSASYTYEDDLLTKIQTASTTYNFTYGNFGLRSSVKVGTQALATYSYTQDGNNYLSSLDYGNGDKVQYEYDSLGRVTKQTYEDGDTVSYQYDNSGALATVTDSATGRKTTYYYDFTDRLMKYVETGTNYYHSVGYEYDQLNNLTSLVETINGTDYTTSYVYDDDNRISSVTTDEAIKIYSYDDYGRSFQQRTTDSNSSLMRLDTFTFKNPSEVTTSPQIIGHTIASQQFSKSYSYTYDDNGNILSVNDGTYTTSYLYDSANQLIRENNEQLGFTYVWTYDSAGNILSCTEYAYTPGSLTDVTPTDTITYTYGNSEWGDLLTAYDGTAITYDEIGNPLSDGTRSYTWEHGRELSSLTQNNVTWNYTYDSNGMRTSRTNGSYTYEYIYNGGQLMQMTVQGYTFSFTYDAAGLPMTIVQDGTIYYYITNIQGDVIGIMDDDGIQVVWYSYDAWGNVSITADSRIHEYNPLLYRGYVYDFETGLYYLQSRYYDPALGRFINADGLVSTGQGLLGNNMFAYCKNNPLRYTDSTGNIPCPAAVTATIKDEDDGPAFVPIRDKYKKKSGMINGQALFPYAQEIMWFGTYANNGCGIIAIYNAMQLLGKPKSLGSIEDTVFGFGGMLAGSLFGMKAEAIGAYFTLQGVDWSFYSSYSKMSQQIYEGAVVVFMIQNDANNILRGFHFMTAQYINGKYTVYNPYINSVRAYDFYSLEEINNGNCSWLCGYIVGGS